MEDKNKKKKLLIILLVIFVLLTATIGGYVLLKLNKSKTEDNNESNVTEENIQDESKFIPYEFTYYSSTEGISKTNEAAVNWATDAKLYSCSGVTSSTVKINDHTYEFVAGDKGDYREWFCEYYSPSKKETMIITYDGEVNINEAIAIGEYSESLYNGVVYPTVSKIISTEILFQGVDLNRDDYYYNIYLVDLSKYGYVWKLEERSKTEKDNFDVGLTIKSYVFDPYTGEIIDTVNGAVY